MSAMADCVFCEYAGPSEVLMRSDWTTLPAYVIEPLNPVVEGHVLVIPEEHVEDWTQPPLNAAAEALYLASNWIEDHPGDYNIIASKGEAATQTVRHLHFHLIPRRSGDGLALPWTAIAAEEARDE